MSPEWLLAIGAGAVLAGLAAALTCVFAGWAWRERAAAERERWWEERYGHQQSLVEALQRDVEGLGAGGQAVVDGYRLRARAAGLADPRERARVLLGGDPPSSPTDSSAGEA